MKFLKNFDSNVKVLCLVKLSKMINDFLKILKKNFLIKIKINWILGPYFEPQCWSRCNNQQSKFGSSGGQ